MVKFFSQGTIKKTPKISFICTLNDEKVTEYSVPYDWWSQFHKRTNYKPIMIYDSLTLSLTGTTDAT